eukprot:TRINITY_DN7760_c0_g2_i1.p1 TRINITY_DN7760_c0_g2~~TRINITY_DN7760_c0_g2_i1.p1  ORF type:complete len:225 (-),score=47.20 TRINITY_DN7760_c0_g2_i1:50-724(-)
MQTDAFSSQDGFSSVLTKSNPNIWPMDSSSLHNLQPQLNCNLTPYQATQFTECGGHQQYQSPFNSNNVCKPNLRKFDEMELSTSGPPSKKRKKDEESHQMFDTPPESRTPAIKRKREEDIADSSIDMEENVGINVNPKTKRKTEHKSFTTKDMPNSRFVLLRFGSDSETIDSKIICKEPFGVMVQTIKENERMKVPLGRRYWAKFTGHVSPHNMQPILDAIHPC